VVLPWWGNHNASEIPKQGDSGAHKQKPRPNMQAGRGFLGIVRASWDWGGRAFWPRGERPSIHY
jgi:hypothetical protein